MARFVGVVALVLSVALPVLSDDRASRDSRGRDETRPPWEWTIEERIELRLNEDHVRHRAQVRDKDDPPGKMGQMFGFGPRNRFIVDGHRNPELLLPHELFVTISSSSETEAGRERYREGLRNFGWDADTFWRTLSEVTAERRRLTEEYLSLHQSLKQLNTLESREVRARIETLDLARCRARFEAYQKMREHYPDNFDRFLYSVVAPNVKMSGTHSGDEAWRLRWAEGGCQ